MAKWSRAQIAVMARAVGWGSHSEDVAEVAMAESGGDDKVVNSIGCVGLLQINQPEHVSAHPKWTRAWLQNPMNNLAAGLVLFKAAGNKFDGPWLDSRDKGGGGGWGGKVSGGVSQIGDDPCKNLTGLAREMCLKNQRLGEEMQENPPGEGSLWDSAQQIGRLAQAVAKAGNWLADPGNWVRIAYVTGGTVLALVAVNVVIQPYALRGYRQVVSTLPARMRPRATTTSSEGE